MRRAPSGSKRHARVVEVGGNYHVRIITNGKGKYHANFLKDDVGARKYAREWNKEFGTIISG